MTSAGVLRSALIIPLQQDERRQLMSIRYFMIENKLTPGLFTARILVGQRVDLDAMIANIARRSSLSLRSEEDEMRLTVYSSIGLRQVVALVPAAVNGTQEVIVRARYTPNGELREGRSPRPVSQT
jgi:hypothetical protein